VPRIFGFCLRISEKYSKELREKFCKKEAVNDPRIRSDFSHFGALFKHST